MLSLCTVSLRMLFHQSVTVAYSPTFGATVGR